jgi:hypothetical protein
MTQAVPASGTAWDRAQPRCLSALVKRRSRCSRKGPLMAESTCSANALRSGRRSHQRHLSGGLTGCVLPASLRHSICCENRQQSFLDARLGSLTGTPFAKFRLMQTSCESADRPRAKTSGLQRHPQPRTRVRPNEPSAKIQAVARDWEDPCTTSIQTLGR